MTSNRNVPLDRGWGLIMRDAGIEVENVLRRARLPAGLTSQDEIRLTTKEYVRFWRALEEESGDPLLPLTIPQAATFEAFHPAIFAALCSPYLSVAVNRLATYKRLIGPMSLIIEDNNDGLYIRVQWDDPVIDMVATHATMELVTIVQLARLATRENICPIRVESRFPLDHMTDYAKYFGTTPIMGDKQGVTFSVADTKRPFLTVNEAMWQSFKPDLQRRLSKLDATLPMSERLRSTLLECLPSGEVAINDVAHRLGVSSRTMQRRLQQEGSSYKDVVRQTREELARHYIVDTTLSYAEIAFLIGFEEASSFFRAFREWTGITPESLRTQQLPAR